MTTKMNTRFPLLAALFVSGLLSISSANAASVEWQLVKQACSSAACNELDPAIASIFVEDIVGGVEFTLSPDWTADSNQPNKINGIDVAFNNPAGDAITTSNFTAGTNPYKSVTVGKPMTSAYVSSGSQFSLAWGGENKFEPGLSMDAVSTWTITGAGITTALFNLALATNNSGKPSSVFAIISTQGVSQFPSAWVTGSPPSSVPVPAAMWLFGTALIGFVGLSRRTKV
jgi:hypothetical protein